MFTLIDDTPLFIVVNKHSNINFHKGNSECGLCEKIRRELDYPSLFPVHRLDTMTSGLLLFAKDKFIAREFSLQFITHSIEKFYCALAGNHPNKKQGTIIGDLFRSRNGKWALSKTKNNPSITQFFSTGLGNGLRLYIIKPHTGRTHQIRVVMKSLGVPVFGDPSYHSKKKILLQSDRGYLHAYALRFILKEKNYTYINLPDSGYWFTEKSAQLALGKYMEPWNLPWPKIKIRPH